MKEKALNLQDFISGELSEKSKCEEDRDRREKGKRMDTPLSFWCMNVEIFQYRGFYQSVMILLCSSMPYQYESNKKMYDLQ